MTFFFYRAPAAAHYSSLNTAVSLVSEDRFWGGFLPSEPAKLRCGLLKANILITIICALSIFRVKFFSLLQTCDSWVDIYHYCMLNAV